MPLTRMTLEERVSCIRLYSQYEKPSQVQIQWRKKFEKDPPSRKTIVAINKKFNETGSICDLSRTGRPKSSRIPEKIAQVESAIRADPTKSLRTISKELGIHAASVHRIKKESEKKSNFLQLENQRLKNKINELTKKIQKLETGPGFGLPLPVSKSSAPEFQVIDIHKRQMSKPICQFSIEEGVLDFSNRVVVVPESGGAVTSRETTQSVITLTSTNCGDGNQILHFPSDTFQIINVIHPSVGPSEQQDGTGASTLPVYTISQ